MPFTTQANQDQALQKTCRAISFDMDGCLFHSTFNQRSNRTETVIDHNRELLDSLKAQNRAYSKVVTFVGSNRQSFWVDLENSIKFPPITVVGSCFPVIEDISTYLGTTLDKLLLADIHVNLYNGTSFDKAMSVLTKFYSKKEDGYYKFDDELFSKSLSSIEQEEHAAYWFDEYKMTLIYAQVHKIASDNRSDTIQFDFYDDRDDILNSLAHFYKQHAVLLPRNVTLCLHQYAGNYSQMNSLEPIHGTGIIDLNYKETVRKMWQITLAASIGKNSIEAMTIEYKDIEKFWKLNIQGVKPIKIASDKTITPENLQGAIRAHSEVAAPSSSASPVSSCSLFVPAQKEKVPVIQITKSDLRSVCLEWKKIPNETKVFLHSTDNDSIFLSRLKEDFEKNGIIVDDFSSEHGNVSMTFNYQKDEILRKALDVVGLMIEEDTMPRPGFPS